MASATYKAFCGGIFETNCYLFETPQGWILFDAPEGACEWVRSLNIHPKFLLLTHGHVDHVQDVAKVKRQFNSQIGCHPLTAPMILIAISFAISGSRWKSSRSNQIFLSKKHQTEIFSVPTSKFWKYLAIAP